MRGSEGLHELGRGLAQVAEDRNQGGSARRMADSNAVKGPQRECVRGSRYEYGASRGRIVTPLPPPPR